MSNRPPRAKHGNSAGGSQGLLTGWVKTLLGNSGSNSEGSTIPNENYDPSFNPNEEGAYAYTQYGYDPKIDYTSPLKDNRSFWQRIGGVPDYAGQVNASVAQANALQPSTIAQAKALGNINTQQAVAQAQGIQGVRQQGEETDLANQGRALFTNANNNVSPGLSGFVNQTLPVPSTIPSSHDLANLARSYLSAYGKNADQGSIAGIPGAQEAEAKSNYNTTLTQGMQPFASTIGGLEGQNKVIGLGLDNQYMPRLAEAKAKTAEGNALTSGVVGQGFNLFNNTYLQPPVDKSVTYDQPFVNPATGKTVPGVFNKAIKEVSSPAAIRQLQPPVSPDEVSRASQVQTQPTPTTVPLVSQQHNQSSIGSQIIKSLISRVGQPSMNNGKVESIISPKEKTDEEKKKEQEDTIKKLLEIINSAAGSSQNRYNQ